MPPRPRRLRMRALPTVRPIILSCVEQEVRVMERGVLVGVGDEWTPAGGVTAAVAEPGLDGAPSVDIPSLSSSGSPGARPPDGHFITYILWKREENRQKSRRGSGRRRDGLS